MPQSHTKTAQLALYDFKDRKADNLLISILKTRYRSSYLNYGAVVFFLSAADFVLIFKKRCTVFLKTWVAYLT